MSGDDALLARARAWAEGDPDPVTAAELRALIERGDLREIGERMAGPLEFGTAGLRGVLGAGESRMNRAVAIRTTAGLAAYLEGAVPGAREAGVVVGYDGRRLSREMASDAASVLLARGFRVYLFAHLGPTPMVAFSVQHRGAAAGVMVTASHNPPEYNGYKVYWGDGAQIVPPHDKGIAAAIDAVGAARDVPLADIAQGRAEGRLIDIDERDERAYLDAIASLSRDRRGRDLLRVVYTPLHGTGDPLFHRAMAEAGFGWVKTVPEQREPDGGFPTVSFPNPEEKGVLDLSVSLATREGANLIIANDPDADRLAVAVPGRAGGFTQLSGNQIGVLLGEHMLRTAGDGPERLVVTTIVSSPMLGQIAADLGVRYAEVLTGHKWIAYAARALARARGDRFVFGYEEALGYAVGTAVRDKDGIGAAAVFAELAAAAASEGRTVLDELERLSRAHGLFASAQRNIVRKGTAGAAELAAMMGRLRAQPPRSVSGRGVREVRDLRASPIGVPGVFELPPSDVLVFTLEGGARIIARPSGTEPKVKVYVDVREQVGCDESFATAEARAFAAAEVLADAFVQAAS